MQVYRAAGPEIERVFCGLDLVSPHGYCPPAVTFVGEWGCEVQLLAESDGSRALYCGVALRPQNRT